MRRVSNLADLQNQRPSFGHMFASNVSINVAIAAANTWTAIASGFTSGLLADFTFQSASELKCGNAGIYLINWSLSVNAVGANDNIEGGITINGTIEPSSISHTRFTVVSSNACLGNSLILNLAVNDVLKFSLNNNSDADDIVMQHAGLTAIRLRN